MENSKIIDELFDCSKCKQQKPRREFAEDRASKRKFRPDCKACCRAFQNAKKYPIPCYVCFIHKKIEWNGNCKKCNFNSDMKICTKCNELKPIKDYRTNPKGTGLSSFRARCQVCEAQLQKEWSAKNPDKVKKQNKNFKIKNPDYFKKYIKQYRIDNQK